MRDCAFPARHLHRFTREASFLGDQAGALELHHRLAAGKRILEAGWFASGKAASDWNLAHGLHTTGDHHILGTLMTACAAKCTARCEEPHAGRW
jgi:hypothetical protein